jgi:hypothetical protein
MMVWKDVIGTVGLRAQAGLEGAPDATIWVDNTKTEEWELLIFDFRGAIGNVYGNFVIFPDKNAERTTASTFYFDNIDYLDVSSVEPVRNEYLKLYPNPADEMLMVEYPGMRKITITNIVGQTIQSMEFRPVGYRQIDISSLETGVYFITIDSKAGVLSNKFIKK